MEWCIQQFCVSCNPEYRWRVVCVVHRWCVTDSTSPILWVRTHHITAVYITPHKLHNFIFHHFIIIHYYATLLYIIIQKWILTEIMYIYIYIYTYIYNFMGWWWHIWLQLYSCAITLKMAGLLAETCRWKYYNLKYIIKLKCICWLLVYFTIINPLFLQMTPVKVWLDS